MRTRKSSHVLFFLYTLDQILRLLHPIMPFVEEIYGQISEGTIVTAEYPTVNPDFEDQAAHTGVRLLKTWSAAVRNSRAEVNVAPSKPITIFWLRQAIATWMPSLTDNVNYIKRFTNPEHLEIAADVEVPELGYVKRHHRRNPLATGWPPQCRRRTGSSWKELAKWQKELTWLVRNLANERFCSQCQNQKSSKKNATNKKTTKLNTMRQSYVLDEMKKLVEIKKETRRECPFCWE